MRTTSPIRFAALMTSLWLLAACAPSATSIGQPPENGDPTVEPTLPGNADDEPGSLCPLCRPQAGGQTSDFSGMTDACERQPQPVTAELESEVELALLQSQLAAGIELPLLWGEPDDNGGRPAASTATGETVLHATFTVEAFEHFASTSCTGYVEAPVTASFSTADGRVQGQARGSVSRVIGELAWQASLSGNLADLTGTPEIPIDTTRIHTARMRLGVHGTALGMRGSIDASVRYYASEADYQSTLVVTDTPAPIDVETVPVFYGWFPEDGCDDRSYPVSVDEPQAWFGGQTPRQIADQSRALLAAEMPVEAQWLDGTRTTVTYEVGALPDRVCLNSNHHWAGFNFESASRLTSADGRIELSLPQASIRAIGGNSTPEQVAVSDELQQLSPSELEAAGVREVDVTGHARIDALIGAWVIFEGGDGSGGRVELFDSTLFDCLVWPVPVSGLSPDCFPIE